MSTLVATMADVAREAGVSIVTVDRVLNQRAVVRPATEQKVLAAAKRLHFALGKVHAIAGEQQPVASVQVPRKLAFFLLRRETVFYQALGQALAAACQADGANHVCDIHFLDGLNPQQCAALFLDKSRGCDAIAMVSVDHPAINQAVDQLSEQGIRTYALVTDITATQRAGYVGLDNRKVGRTAAWAISRLSRGQGSVGLLVGDHRFLCQELSEMSFRSYLREHRPDLRLLDTCLTHESPEEAREVTLRMLDEQPDLLGLYVNGGGIEGVMDALRHSGRHQDVVLIGHEVMDSTRTGLVDGVLDLVISLRREESAKALIDLMIQQPGATAGSASVAVMVPFDLVTAENI